MSESSKGMSEADRIALARRIAEWSVVGCFLVAGAIAILWPSALRPTTPTEFWTMVTAITQTLAILGSIALGLLAWLGLGSLSLTRKEIRSRFSREAIEAAIIRCQEMAQDLIPENRDLLAAMAAAKVDLYVKSPERARFGVEVERQEYPEAKRWTAALTPDVAEKAIHLLNRLEWWSAYFVTKFADRKIAYEPCAPLFLSMVMQLYPLLVVLRAENFSGNYPNVVSLAEDWADLKKGADGRAEMKAILSKLEVLQSRVPESGSEDNLHPPAIGTEPD